MKIVFGSENWRSIQSMWVLHETPIIHNSDGHSNMQTEQTTHFRCIWLTLHHVLEGECEQLEEEVKALEGKLKDVREKCDEEDQNDCTE